MSRLGNGFTMTEILLASALMTVVIIGLTQVDVSLFRMEKALRDRTGLLTDKHAAALASLQLARDLQRADRINIVDPSVPVRIQLRLFEPTADAGSCTCIGAGIVPASCCYDLPENYRWVQYQREPSTNTLELYPNTRDPSSGATVCAGKVDLASHITSLTFQYKDVSAPPPGGDPDPAVFTASPADLNIIEYALLWDDGQAQSLELRSSAASRAIPYSNVNAGRAGRGDSGTGLDFTGISDPVNEVSPPPVPCT